MKIARLELFHIAIPFATPYRLSKAYGTQHEAHAIILKMHTDDGVVGLGEADPLNPFTEETPGTVMAVMREVIGPRLLGQNPTRVGALVFALDGAVLGNLTAKGAVDMALHDILGKVKGVPVHVLFGGPLHAELPILWGIGSGSPAEDAAAIEELMALGCRTVMIKMGALPIADDITRMSAARRRFEDHLHLVVDANQGWETTQALAFIDGIQGHAPDLIEQPIPHWDHAGLRRIRQQAPCPVSADESLVGVHDAAALIRGEAVDVFSLKASKNGGIAKCRQIAQAADTFGLKCLMNSMLEFGITQAASLQVGCTLGNLLPIGHAYGSVVRMADDVTDFGRNVSGATVHVPAGAGLGVALDEEKLKKYTKDYLEIR
jgi:L-alanine-DL-glutamate epimerase-like enolase superfamily enzyme